MDPYVITTIEKKHLLRAVITTIPSLFTLTHIEDNVGLKCGGRVIFISCFSVLCLRLGILVFVVLVRLASVVFEPCLVFPIAMNIKECFLAHVNNFDSPSLVKAFKPH